MIPPTPPTPAGGFTGVGRLQTLESRPATPPLPSSGFGQRLHLQRIESNSSLNGSRTPPIDVTLRGAPIGYSSSRSLTVSEVSGVGNNIGLGLNIFRSRPDISSGQSIVSMLMTSASDIVAPHEFQSPGSTVVSTQVRALPMTPSTSRDSLTSDAAHDLFTQPISDDQEPNGGSHAEETAPAEKPRAKKGSKGKKRSSNSAVASSPFSASRSPQATLEATPLLAQQVTDVTEMNSRHLHAREFTTSQVSPAAPKLDRLSDAASAKAVAENNSTAGAPVSPAASPLHPAPPPRSKLPLRQVHNSTVQIANGMIKMLMLELRHRPSTCLKGVSIVLRLGLLPFRSTLIDLVQLMGGEVHDVSLATSLALASSSPYQVSKRYLIHDGKTEGESGAMTHFPDLEVIDLLGLLDIVMTRRTRELDLVNMMEGMQA
ncbi:hypothetical protein I316_02590 [Kwoniella heveanensis BCC8398]|uniref:BRCT domain-containing protein n=1 Tax=Kwoniella heveanensis BCC8398 TaxID=1296120 RepID=A0A1B9GWY9_9TREE|nr:hypothetical protein I316_02590 [Kwoniella heveanensis BCC8398]